MTESISAVILAGGLARRMAGRDKGLQPWHGRPLFRSILERLAGQVRQISINANRNQAIYAQAGYSVFPDELEGFQGPLSGMLTALHKATTDFVLFVPCDCPNLPLNLREKLQSAVSKNGVLIAYAHDGERAHPAFCLMSVRLKNALSDYLARGERRLLKFMQENQAAAVDFSEAKAAFINLNTLEDLANNEAEAAL